MKITKKTLTKAVLPLLTPERVEYIVQNIPTYPLEKQVLNMTVGEFLECCQPEYTERLLAEPLAYKAFGRVAQLRKELAQVQAFIKKFDIPMSADEKAASAGIEWVDASVRMCLDAIRWGIVNPSEGEEMLEAAERVKLTTWLATMQDNACKAQFERNMAKIRERAMKAKGGRK